MGLSVEKQAEYSKRLMLSRMRILCRHGFYGLLLMHMTFGLDEYCRTAYTDAVRICFSPDFLETLSDSELDFIMLHEILHVVLQHCMTYRAGYKYDDNRNIAADIVVNSMILSQANNKPEAIMIHHQELMHIAPNGKEGHLYTTEQVYAMLPKLPSKRKESICGSVVKKSKSSSKSVDDHSHWGDHADDDLQSVWEKRIFDACGAILETNPTNRRGLIPSFILRRPNELKKPQTDWRTLLNDFVQEETADYSFNPPDRRFHESSFFLPAFNDTEASVKDILFMVDTSGSITDSMLTAAYSEIKAAIEQFDGKLQGWLGFFDHAVTTPQPFCGETELQKIRPIGGGGTDFQIIFEYVMQHMQNDPPSCIIILTDGYAPFPEEALANGIPVLWLINNEDVQPPWGKVGRFIV